LYIDVRDDRVGLRDNSNNPDKTQHIKCKIAQNKWQKKRKNANQSGQKMTKMELICYENIITSLK